jgi:superkiller protein 3
MVISILFLIRPFMARIYWYYGNQQRFYGNNNKAISIYKKALEWNPWQGDIYIDLANSLRITSNTQAALKNLHRAEIFTDHPFLPGNIAYLYNNEGESEKVIPYLEKAIKYQQDRESMLLLQLQLGDIYLASKDYKNAERHFAGAIENDSNSADAYYGLAKAYRNQGKKEQAIEAFEKVIELAPESELAVSAKAMLIEIGTEE